MGYVGVFRKGELFFFCVFSIVDDYLLWYASKKATMILERR